ncbi:hypothetical protein AWB71_05340 [Caballeronia peredens]|nr:hypothetical protein AWB71_05340 [Caballeronia peredens]
MKIKEMSDMTDNDWAKLFLEQDKSYDALATEKTWSCNLEKSISKLKTAEIHLVYQAATNTIYQWNRPFGDAGVPYGCTAVTRFKEPPFFSRDSSIPVKLRLKGTDLAIRYGKLYKRTDIKALEPVLIVGRKGGYFGTDVVFIDETLFKATWTDGANEFCEPIKAHSQRRAFKAFYEKQIAAGYNPKTFKIKSVVQA